MTEPELAVVSAAGAGLGWIVRWAVGLWAEVRREDIASRKDAAIAAAAAAKEAAEIAKETNATMVGALLAQAKSNEQLAGEHARGTLMLSGKIDALLVKLDTIAEWRERTPVEGVPIEDFSSERPSSRPRQRLRTVPQGHRVPRTDHDE